MDIRIIERIFSNKENLPTILLANINHTTNIEYNLKKMEEIIEIAHRKNVNIVIFPELFITGYIWNTNNDNEIINQLHKGENSKLKYWIKNIKDSLSKNSLEYVFYNNVRCKNKKFHNSTFIINYNIEHDNEDYIYDKIFLTPIEQRYFKKGTDKRLIIDTKWGRFGFMICYDLAFVDLARKYSFEDDVDCIVTMASWQSQAIREYPEMNIKTDHYYGFLWDLMNASKSAYNQIWSIGVNAVGRHPVNEDYFWGRSGVWTPSGLTLLQASNINEELLIIRNLDIINQRKGEQDCFNYRIDFEKVYKEIAEEDTEMRIIE